MILIYTNQTDQLYYVCMSNQLSYDARQVSSQGTQRVMKRIYITTYEIIKAAVEFIGHMIKILLAK